MLSNVFSIGLSGIDGYLVTSQVDMSFGMPAWEIVGLPDATVRESKERVRTAIKNSGYEIHSRKIVINLCPACTRKEGSSFDLAISIGILSNLGIIDTNKLKDFVFIGELSLNGDVERVNGILPMCITAKKLGINKAIIPYDNRTEAGVLNDFEVFPVKNLNDVVSIINLDNIKAYKTNINTMSCSYDEDFSDVKGQELAKRAIEIAAAGFHNIIMIGSPGTGKTMLAKRIPSILPDLSFEESLDITKIYSVAGLIKKDSDFIINRPFRSPHYTATHIAIIGGGRIPKPGEISLAHNGVLFMDEFAEFDRGTIESLRTPIEDGNVIISRINSTVKYPCKFMLVASMNPCPCGYANDVKKKCTCTNSDIQRYLRKISGPIMDRIDLQVEVSSIDYEKLMNNSYTESSKSIKERVTKARMKQLNRYKLLGIKTNSELKGKLLEEFCTLKSDAQSLMRNVYEKYSLSIRAYERIIKLSRTIADLDESESIYVEHVAEALQYRLYEK